MAVEFQVDLANLVASAVATTGHGEHLATTCTPAQTALLTTKPGSSPVCAPSIPAEVASRRI